MSELDRLIHEPSRLRLVAELYVVDEADFSYISKRTGLTAGNLSSHMTRLEDAGYIEMTKSFVGKRPRTTYRLTQRGRSAFEAHRRAIADVLGI
jgi:DNA-binding MarR family transcriptional regulator